MFRIIEITETAAKLSITSGCLSIHTKEKEEHYSLRDIDALILANPAISLTGCALNEIVNHKAIVVICERSYRPTGMLLPIGSTSGNHSQSFDLQINASIPLKKQLWQHIIKRKISNQSIVLQKYRNSNVLTKLASQVRSGDNGNIEGRAASLYWKHLDIIPRRDRTAEDANAALNYAYTILYSATARYICAHALHPHIGVKHHNKYNPFCLASDLMEPYRAFAEIAVLKLLENTGENDALSYHDRRFLIETIYNTNVLINGHVTNIFKAIHETVTTFKQCLDSKISENIHLPSFSA